jgi:Ornithine cyclodeaminase/mu-crystallin family
MAAFEGPSSAGAFEPRRAIECEVITADHVHAEISELISGTMTGRSDDRQMTLYRSVGVAVPDAARPPAWRCAGRKDKASALSWRSKRWLPLVSYGCFDCWRCSISTS